MVDASWSWQVDLSIFEIFSKKILFIVLTSITNFEMQMSSLQPPFSEMEWLNSF